MFWDLVLSWRSHKSETKYKKRMIWELLEIFIATLKFIFYQFQIYTIIVASGISIAKRVVHWLAFQQNDFLSKQNTHCFTAILIPGHHDNCKPGTVNIYIDYLIVYGWNLSWKNIKIPKKNHDIFMSLNFSFFDGGLP